MESATDKSPYVPIEQPDAPPPRVQRQSSRQAIRRKVSRAFSTLTRRTSSTATSSEESDTSPPSTPSVSPAASRTSTTQMMTIVERERVEAWQSNSYPLVRLDPVLIGCFVCL
ncbi:hypothetical protein BN946_scf185010.g39 [Trametes cinnabarina]|uniref:Uncharacterized protein n=1 Tax=Pycnoporus cinnabarinus TaxID=5643 RepID=A0A060SSB1_PYCCI|nr:hypothetical protein BN946_scf185010.g39 [Trametes cinnabarina]